MEKQFGITKWFNATRGFGFIISGDHEYFVHYSNIEMDGFKTLEDGQHVSFFVEETDRGEQAVSVFPIVGYTENE